MITLQVIRGIYFMVAGMITVAAIITMFFDNSLTEFMPGGFFTGLAILVFGNIL